MSIWNKIIIGFVFVAAVAFFYMAVRTLKTHEYWRNTASAYEFFIQRAIENQEALVNGGDWLPTVEDAEAIGALRDFYRKYERTLNVSKGMAWSDFEKNVLDTVVATGKVDLTLLTACAEGKQEIKGIEATRLALFKALIGRGRVWRECVPAQANKDTGQVSVTVDLPDPHGILDKTILCVMEEGEVQQGSRFIGEFKVVGIDQKRIALEPTRSMGALELERLVKSQGPWILYEDMPADEHEVFAELEEAAKKELIPEGSVAEYHKDGQPAEKDDPEERQVDGKYVRQLRDYSILFEKYHVRRSILADLKESYDRDIKYVSDTLDDAKVQEQSLEQWVAAVKKELEQLQRERTAVAEHLAQVEAKAKYFQGQVVAMMVSNRGLAGELAKRQLDATRWIEARAQRMAQAPGSGN